VDTSVYVSSNAHGQGIGKTLYSAIFPILRLQGYINAYAGITLPNPASMSLHKSFGFTQICVYGQVGYKGDAWHDVAWLERRLQPRTVPPAEPRSLPILVAGGEFSLPELPSGGTGA
jgi:phosphinothricin acetyltransferase